MNASPSLIYLIADIIQGAMALAVLAVIIWIWRKGPRWARIVIIGAGVLIALAAAAFGLYVHALGQANWSY